jgi:hypothetical protein
LPPDFNDDPSLKSVGKRVERNLWRHRLMDNSLAIGQTRPSFRCQSMKTTCRRRTSQVSSCSLFRT